MGDQYSPTSSAYRLWNAEQRTLSQPTLEIQLMHRAPVVGILVLDGHGSPLPEPLEVAHDLARSPDMQGSHHLLVISEEQFKVFTLPKVSAKMKLKLTAIDGSRVRRVGVAWFGSSRTDDYGESFYLISPSEFERFSLSARCVVEPRSLVEVPSQTPTTTLPWASPDGASVEHRNSTRDSNGVESSARRVMEHALLNDETVLQEIQKSLEVDQTTFLENGTSALAGGKVLSNGGQLSQSSLCLRHRGVCLATPASQTTPTLLLLPLLTTGAPIPQRLTPDP
ncbi:unnamed protein product [Coregonus sp. 'balchen']|nr:unnamed protein product [Coregonus sp. 'balchen']